MDLPDQPSPSEEQRSAAPSEDDGEVVDGLIVISHEPASAPATPAPSSLARSAGAVIPAVQAAAVAAGGFVAGAAVVGLVNRRQRSTAALAKGRRGARSLARGPRTHPEELVQIVSSTRLLVDVHVLGVPGRDR